MKTYEPHDPYELMIIPPNKQAEMIIQEIESNVPNLNLVSDLIVLGANVNWQDEDNYNLTPLHWAALNGSVEIARMLIDAGADVNVQTNGGRTPLHWAARRGEVEIARMLIDAGADVNVQDEWGKTSLHYAAEYEQIEVIKMLLDAGAIKDIPTNRGQFPYDLAKTEEIKTILRVV